MNFLQWGVTVLIVSRNSLKSERKLSPFGELTVPAPGGSCCCHPEVCALLGGCQSSVSPLGACGAEQGIPHRLPWVWGLPARGELSLGKPGPNFLTLHPKLPGCWGSTGWVLQSWTHGSLGQGSGLPSPGQVVEAGSKDSIPLYPCSSESQKEVTLSHTALFSCWCLAEAALQCPGAARGTGCV